MKQTMGLPSVLTTAAFVLLSNGLRPSDTGASAAQDPKDHIVHSLADTDKAAARSTLDEPMEIEAAVLDITRKCGEPAIKNKELQITLSQVCTKAYGRADGCLYADSFRMEAEREPADKKQISGYDENSKWDKTSNSLKVKYWLHPHEDCVKGPDDIWTGSDSFLSLKVFVTVKPKT